MDGSRRERIKIGADLEMKDRSMDRTTDTIS